MKELFDIFNIQKDWLKFAEAKNAALIAILGVFIRFYIAGLESSVFYVKLYSLTALPIISIALFVAVLSFIPKVDFQKITRISFNKKTVDCNVIFFENISHMNVSEYRELLSKKLEATFNSFDLDVINQVYANACIASRKYAMFRIAVVFTVLAIFTPLSGFILYFYIRAEK